jgi:hypothetical protein
MFRRPFTLAVLALALAFGRCAVAADLTDHWWSESESGWGLSVTQQEEVAFVVIFVYGPNGQPLWLTATTTRYGTDIAGNPGFAGALYATSGPPQGGPFDPAKVNAAPVGTVSFQAMSPTTAMLEYTYNNATIRKNVRRFTFRNKNWTGTYRAALRANYDGCPADFTPPFIYDDGIMDVEHDGSKFTLFWDGRKSVCTFTGAYQQDGRLGSVSGTYACTAGPQGEFKLSKLETNGTGLSAVLEASHPSCSRMDEALSGFALDAR